MCAKNKGTVFYVDPETDSTPLHLACGLIDIDPAESHSAIHGIRSLIKIHPDALSCKDVRGNIPLHYAIAPLERSDDFVAHIWERRAEVLRILIASDYESSIEYLSRNDVIFDVKDEAGACTPLYRAIEQIPDDSGHPGPTVSYISVIQESNPGMVSVGNSSDGDKPLALLYRRFTRQFDISEKFFAGDNSRPEVVEHRRTYKISAGNTWKIIELLLRPSKEESVASGSSSGGGEWRIVHRAVQVDTPPDLLRYIVETNAEELTQRDDAGNLPLHYAAMSTPPAPGDQKEFPPFYTKYVVDELLYKFPEGAGIPNRDDKYPLTLAVDTGKQFIGGGVKSLFDAYPEALKQTDLMDKPELKRVFSLLDADGNNSGDDDEDEDDLLDDNEGSDEDETPAGIVKDEHHDAIMLVQKKGATVSEVVTCMWAYEEDAGVQMLGSMAIAKMAEAANDSDKLRIALGAVAAVVNAMKAHPNEPIVQEKASSALKHMASADGKREVSFVALGAIAAIVGAMQAHVGDAVVQEEACSAISEIVWSGGADRATIVASVSGITAILNALAAHADEVKVQREGCRALRMMTEYKDANLPELPRSQTEPLLEAAKSAFAEECGENAEIILSRLQS
mmetsp:Transcript_929/g.1472  ORF Transcript_929/g.1472 Transcript_929/m.1472 type:complete len:622 (-) Transcript_929:135-2000(-)